MNIKVIQNHNFQTPNFGSDLKTDQN